MALPDQAVERVAQYFRALAEPMRLRIVNALRSQPHSVGELTELFGCSQANISKHLRVLADAHIVTRTTQGTTTQVSIADPAIFQLCELVCDSVARDLAQDVALHKALTKVHRRG